MLFQSHDAQFRAPFGAVPAGTAIHFRICLPRWLGCSAARLVVRNDDGIVADDGMFWCGMEGEDSEWWECHYAPAVEGLYYHRFELSTAFGGRYLHRQPDSSALLSTTGDGDWWQITCYDPAFVTPDWLAGGIFYQIFPDRFARSDKPKSNVPNDRILREDWGGQPGWRPDAQGKVRNNDYFGGDLRGIEQRLDHLVDLGVTCLYLNPIFEAHSNHRYDTADYSRIDPLLGDEADFRSLCATAAKLGIRVMLDGVFSHTGSDSRYFNKEGRYPPVGAHNTPDSPYASWYRFRHWPDSYASWWGFETLPEVEENDLSFLSYITGKEGIVRRWLAAGASGWRLDVADELPDTILDALRAAVKQQNPQAVLLGEVWEDASNKYSYGQRRRYLLGKQLDSVMNYPFRDAILGFLCGGDADMFFHIVMDVLEHYPPQVVRLLMNSLGTHDTERALTVLAGEPAHRRGRDWQATQHLSPEQRAYGLTRMQLASALQYCLPGIPCVYYGDEAGAEGYRDPFNRGCYPWGTEDDTLLQWHRKLGQMRRNSPVLAEGGFSRVPAANDVVCFERTGNCGGLLCAVNRAAEPREVALPARWQHRTVNLGGGQVVGDCLHLPANGCAILMMGDEE